MTEDDLLTAYRAAIAATDDAERAVNLATPWREATALEALQLAADEERLAARAYLAVRAASVAGQENRKEATGVQPEGLSR